MRRGTRRTKIARASEFELARERFAVFWAALIMLVASGVIQKANDLAAMRHIHLYQRNRHEFSTSSMLQLKCQGGSCFSTACLCCYVGLV